MRTSSFTYIIIGGGLAGASAIQGIRETDASGSILLLGNEEYLPYDRPPLSKNLWLGKTHLDAIFPHDIVFYHANHVELKLGVAAVGIDSQRKTVTDDFGRNYSYQKLLLATGGQPRRLTIPGHDLEGVCYFRSLDDYKRIRLEASQGKSALVIGGGFIGSEMAAALCQNGLKVTMLFPEPYLCQTLFPRSLGETVLESYLQKGVAVFKEDVPVSISKDGKKFLTKTQNGRTIDSDIVIAGIGIRPDMDLAFSSGLMTENGILMDDYLRTSDPDIYAAGDNANFPCKALGKRMRFEHWDNALNQGKHAGRNMAGANMPFEYLSYFFSDFFEFGYEAVGEIHSGLKTVADWEETNHKGIVYYLEEDKIRGMMMCNVWGKVEMARDLIMKGTNIREDLWNESPGRRQAGRP